MNCQLCDQPIFTPVHADGSTFCCHGCRELWRLLGPEELTELKSRPGVNWEYLRNQLAAEKPTANARDMNTITLNLDGIWCASCSILVEQVLNRVPGVVSVSVDFASSAAEVAIDKTAVSSNTLVKTVQKLGYGAKEQDVESSVDMQADLKLLRKFSVSALLSVIVMMLSVPVWSGYLTQLPSGVHFALAIGLWLLATPVLFWGGWTFLRGAYASVVHRVPTMDLLIAMGSIAAYGYSVYSVITDKRYLYFDSASMLIAFLLLSRSLEVGTRNRTSGVVRLLSKLSVKEAIVLRAGTEHNMMVTEVAIGDTVVVRPGQKIPVDGKVVAGYAAVNESFLTGEAIFVHKDSGDTVYAGSLSTNGQLHIEATRMANESVLAQTERYVKAAQGAKTIWRRLSDSVLRVFVPVVLIASGITFAIGYGWAHIGFTASLLRAIAMLVVACPCAMSVATPLVVLAGTQRLGEQGLLLRSEDVMERANHLTSVVFDKTGTLTMGEFSVSMFTPSNDELLRLVAAAEYPSEHPIARAIVASARDRGIELPPAHKFLSETGWGVQAVVDGHCIRVGAYRDNPANISLELKSAIERAVQEKMTIATFYVDERLAGVIGLSDTLRQEAKTTISELMENGFEVTMLTGDSEAAARAVASSLGITDWRAQIKPLEKAEYIKGLKANGKRVLFVGDGVNDAPALVESDLSVAMGAGADIAREAGQLILLSENLTAIVQLLNISKLTARVIKQNLSWSLSYNAIALLIAAAGYAQPAIAAFAMVMSSAFVLGNSLRIVGWSARRYAKGGVAILGLLASLAVIAWVQI